MSEICLILFLVIIFRTFILNFIIIARFKMYIVMMHKI